MENTLASRITRSNWAITFGSLVLAVAALAILIGRFGSSSGSSEPHPLSGRMLADFTLPDVNGGSVNLRDYAAGRPVVISFGTTTCPYCVLQMRAFKELKEKYGDRVALLEINVAEPAEVAAAHAKRVESPVPTLLDQDARVYLRYGNNAVPVTVVADAEGRIIEIGSYIPAGRLADLLKLNSEAAASRPAQAGT